MFRRKLFYKHATPTEFNVISQVEKFSSHLLFCQRLNDGFVVNALAFGMPLKRLLRTRQRNLDNALLGFMIFKPLRLCVSTVYKSFR